MRRRRVRISLSASGLSSTTIAPCRSRKTASQPPCCRASRSACSSGRTSCSKVAREQAADGQDSAATGVMISAPSRIAMSMNAAIGVAVPPKRARASRPNAGPAPWPNFSSGVGIGENVLVSCLIRAMMKRIAMNLFLSLVKRRLDVYT